MIEGSLAKLACAKSETHLWNIRLQMTKGGLARLEKQSTVIGTVSYKKKRYIKARHEFLNWVVPFQANYM